MDRILYISTAMIQEACKDKKSLEALAFVVDVKMMFVDSVIRDFTYRKGMSLFGTSNVRLKRIIAKAKDLGFISFDGHTLVAHSLHSICNNPYHYKFQFVNDSYSVNEKKTSSYSLNEIMDKLRRMAVVNHVSKQNDCSNTIKRMSDPRCASDLRKARRKAKRMLKSSEAHNGLSLTRVMQLAGCCRNKARKIMNGLVSDKTLKRWYKSYKTSLKPHEFDGISANKWFHESGHFGFLYNDVEEQCVMCRVSNEYTLLNRKAICAI